MSIIKSKLGVSIVTGVVAFIIGGAVFSNGSELDKANNNIDTLNTINEELEKDIKNLKDENSKLLSRNTELSNKVDEAKPYFDMKEEEKAQLEEQTRKEKEEREAREQAEAEAKKQAELEAKTIELSNGNYVAGQDFEAGTYTITAISGGGNVSSSNLFNGGINAIMGTANDGFYELEYKNIKLPQGTTLTIDGVTVRLTPVQ